MHTSSEFIWFAEIFRIKKHLNNNVLQKYILYLFIIDESLGLKRNSGPFPENKRKCSIMVYLIQIMREPNKRCMKFSIYLQLVCYLDTFLYIQFSFISTTVKTRRRSGIHVVEATLVVSERYLDYQPAAPQFLTYVYIAFSGFFSVNLDHLNTPPTHN